VTQPQPQPVPDAFVRAHTRPVRPPLVPEVQLLVATDVVALWEAMEDERGGPAEDPPFWAAAWPGGQALARYVLDHPAVVAGRTVLDLASGSGLVAVAAALAGAARVRACDVDELAAAAVRLNAAGNGAAVEVVLADLLDGEAGAEVVLAGDVFYERAMARRVLAFLERAARAGAEVLVGDPGRAHLPVERLAEVARYEVPVVGDLEDAAVRSAAVRRLVTAPPAGR
jgi:predicted nicotinamide N-methyase